MRSHPAQKFALKPDVLLESGKMARLKSLLVELRARGSRPLIFSQWTTVLDIMEWALDSWVSLAACVSSCRP
jgi:SWI/SNF-related matrix-associated actin-dependent regulator 1 of chromatin subfamily A